MRPPKDTATVQKFSSKYAELRIHGSGDTGKGDRTSLLSAKEARKLAYSLLALAEEISA